MHIAQVRPPQAHRGDLINIVGGELAAAETVVFVDDTGAEHRMSVRWAGSYSAQVTVPAALAPGRADLHVEGNGGASNHLPLGVVG